MNKLELVKGITEFVVGVGVASVVGNAIKITTSPDHGKYKKAAIGIGGFVLSRMVGDFASAYAVKEIDDTAAKIQRIFGPKVVVVDPPETTDVKDVDKEEVPE